MLWKIKIENLLSQIKELEVLKHLSSFPYWQVAVEKYPSAPFHRSLISIDQITFYLDGLSLKRLPEMRISDSIKNSILFKGKFVSNRFCCDV